jgi:hypothetical protein
MTRRRGRIVPACVAVTVVIIGVGSSLAAECNAGYDAPGWGRAWLLNTC